MTAEELILFEEDVANAWRDGRITSLFHLSGGNESALLRIFAQIKPNDYVFSTHRCHYHALLKGIPKATLWRRILDGKSMYVFSRERRFLASSITAGGCAMAVGVAMAIVRRGGCEHVWCFVGDGAVDSGHFYEAVRYASSERLPITFVVEDNNVASSVTCSQRGASEMVIQSDLVMYYAYRMTRQHCQAPSDEKIVFKERL